MAVTPATPDQSPWTISGFSYNVRTAQLRLKIAPLALCASATRLLEVDRKGKGRVKRTYLGFLIQNDVHQRFMQEVMYDRTRMYDGVSFEYFDTFPDAKRIKIMHFSNMQNDVVIKTGNMVKNMAE